MQIRRAQRSDAQQIAHLYYDTVRRVNSRDYATEKISAWAPRVYPVSFWRRRGRQYSVLVADDGGELLGFAELGADGEIDCFYVHHAHQRRGVGRALVGAVVREARRRGLRRLFADVSITARPFFRCMGFQVVRRRTRRYRGRAFALFQMQRRLR